MTSQIQNYQKPIGLTNSKERYVHFEEISPEKDNSEEEYDASASSTEEENSTDDNSQQDDKQETTFIRQKEICKIQASPHGITILANSSSTILIHKDKEEIQNTRNYLYHFERTTTRLKGTYGFFDQSAELIVNQKSIKIHLYNQTSNEVLFEPHEEIGMLEKFDL